MHIQLEQMPKTKPLKLIKCRDDGLKKPDVVDDLEAILHDDNFFETGLTAKEAEVTPYSFAEGSGSKDNN